MIWNLVFGRWGAAILVVAAVAGAWLHGQHTGYEKAVLEWLKAKQEAREAADGIEREVDGLGADDLVGGILSEPD